MTAAASQVTTKPPGRRTRKESAPTREKRHFRETAGDPGNRCSVPGKAREAGARGSRTARQSGDACGRAIGRAILLARQRDESGNAVWCTACLMARVLGSRHDGKKTDGGTLKNLARATMWLLVISRSPVRIAESVDCEIPTAFESAICL